MANEAPLIIGRDWAVTLNFRLGGAALPMTDWSIQLELFWKARNPNTTLDPSNVIATYTSGDGMLNATDAAAGEFTFTPPGATTLTYDPRPDNLPGVGAILAGRVTRVDGGRLEHLCDLLFKVKF